MTPEQAGNLLKAAYAQLQQGRFDSAIERIQQVTAAYANNDQAFNLLGVAFANRGDTASSLTAFRRSIAINPENAGSWSNLGNALAQAGQQAEAVEAYEQALRIAPGKMDSLFNLAVAHGHLGQQKDARKALEQIVKLDPGQATAWAMLGQLGQAEGQADEALENFDRALALNPDSVAALHGKSTLLLGRQNFAKAIENSQRAVRLQPRIAGIHQTLGRCHAALGKTDLAIDAFNTAVRLEPLRDAHHVRLNDLLWVEGRSEFLDSYRQVLAANPGAHPLRRALAFRLFQAGRLDDALEQAVALVETEPENASNHQLLGGVLRKRRSFEAAIESHRAAVRLNPEHKDGRQELATSLMANGEAGAALEILEALCREDALHQGYVALKATALRMLGSEAYRDLHDYDRLVHTSLIEAPPGFSSIQDFNRELSDYLLTLHTTKEHPLDQSLVNGTQTVDDLFLDNHELIHLLSRSFDQVTQRMLDKLPRETGHPALSRNNGAFSSSGAWSVLLRGSGFHLNHYHSHGWYSGPYYVDVPAVVEDEEKKQGWLKLGEPGFECIQALPADHTVRPEPGLMVRFPSYMWHGTVPFESEQTRLVVSQDIEPG